MSVRRVFLLGLVAAFASAASCAPKAQDPASVDELTISTIAGEAKFKVEIAATDEERRIGLMYRTSLPENGGMLFDFTHENSIQSMWMKNTLIPLDIVFIAKDGQIINIAAETTPRSLASIRSRAPAAGVLEVRGGRMEELGVRPGDIVHHPLFGDK